jgi:hypothetical protein
MTWSPLTTTLPRRVLKITDALKVAYQQDEIDNIRLVITVQEAIEYRDSLDRNRFTSETIERPIPIPVPGLFWVKLYGVDVWIRERS